MSLFIITPLYINNYFSDYNEFRGGLIKPCKGGIFVAAEM
ncbi:Uncharacterized protein dnm_095610 [Desulfonema magnum]|uniref:Uncharacterized protein n=1 Tax=Desulfonema magnum TaxID=45655 RepID=A0A975BYJ8_9BACT|nr:Uncharacterized protein dnm_095610 [Desulfonema magnum]